jgi:replicative DNA helicase Mcm
MAFTVEEDYEDRPGTEVKSIKCIVSGDLLKVGPAERFIRGNRVRVIGIYLARQIKNKANKDKIELEPFVEVNNVDFLNDTFMDIKITDEDRERIKMIAYRPDAISYLSEQMFSSIYGYPEVKKALICQLFGAPKAQRGHKYTRGDIHVLLIGDPSTSKSTFLQISHMLSLKGAFSSGKSTTAVGITAMVHRDETLGTWIVEAGAFPLSNGGIYALDEADKVSEEDKSSLHEAMESQVVSVTKANIHTSLRCEAGLLAAANPKKGRFDINSDIFSQIDMQPTLVNRFDMVFIFIDRSDATIDGKVADRIFDGDNTKEEITRELFKKYLLIAKELTPELSKEGTVKIKEMYLNIRKANDGAGIPISPRQLESAVRLAKAHARVRLSKAVDDVDIKFAIDMIQYYLSKIAIDKITGCVDVDFIETGMCTSERQLLDVIPKLISLSEKRELNFEEIRSKISDKVDERTLEKAIAKLKQGGDIYEPRPDLYRMTRGGFIE